MLKTGNYILYRSSQTKDLTSKVLNTNTQQPYISGSTITLSSSSYTSPTPANAYFQFVTPATPTVKYGKVTLAASVSNGTYNI